MLATAEQATTQQNLVAPEHLECRALQAYIAKVRQTTIKHIELCQLAPTLDLLISLGQALALKVRNLVDAPAITNSDPEV
jgi:hypothetical protein